MTSFFILLTLKERERETDRGYNVLVSQTFHCELSKYEVIIAKFLWNKRNKTP